MQPGKKMSEEPKICEAWINCDEVLENMHSSMLSTLSDSKSHSVIFYRIIITVRATPIHTVPIHSNDVNILGAICAFQRFNLNNKANG